MRLGYGHMSATLPEGGAGIILDMIDRRRLMRSLLAAAAVVASGTPSRAQQRRSLSDPLRLGVDPALADSGLARALLQGFGRDTGIAVKLVTVPSLPLLDGIDRGEFDAALANAPDAEARLEQQGLAHDRRSIAKGEFVLVGPAPSRHQKDPAAIAGLRDAAEALIQVRGAALAMPDRVEFLSAGDGSGVHVCEQALWRQARLGPAAPWYRSADAQPDLVAQARARGAYALVERGAWAVRGGAPLAVLVEGDPRLAEAIHAMRSFRVAHPAGKIFVAWIAGPKGGRVVSAQRAYRAA